MCTYSRLLLIVLLLFSCFFSKAQVYHFKHYEIPVSESFNYVSSIMQDNKGYMHFGLNGAGVAKFDGFKFQLSDNEDSIDNRVVCLLEDNRSNLWVGTARGLFFKHKGAFIRPDIEGWEEIENLRIFSLAQDKYGHIYVGTSSGIFQIYIKDDKKKLYHLKSEEQVFCVYVDRNNLKWFGTAKHLYSLDKESMSRERYLKLEAALDVGIKCMSLDIKGRFWIGGYNGGLYRKEKDQLINVGAQLAYNGDKINAIKEDLNGNIWLGSASSGLWKFDNDDIFTNYTIDNGLHSNNIYSLEVDHENNLWLSTTDQLVSVFRGEQFINYNRHAGLISNFILSIYQDKSGAYWFGSDEGINQLENGKIKDFAFNSIGLDNINDITEDDKGNLWFATNSKGVLRYDGNSTQQYSVIKGKSFLCAFADKNDDVWFGTFGHGIYRFNHDKLYHYNIGKGLMSNIIYSIYQLNDGSLLFGTERGVLKWDSGKFLNYFKNGLLNYPIFGMEQDADGYLWVATYGGGLVRCNPRDIEEKLLVVNKDNGLNTNEVLGIVIDAKQDIWISSEKDVKKFNLSQFNKTTQLNMFSFGSLEGFHGKECNPRSIYKDNQGNIWFGTISGAIKYDIKNTSIKEDPKIYITDIKVHNNKPDWSKYSIDSVGVDGLPYNLLLPHFDNYLTFDFVSLSYKNPEGSNIQYKLSGAIDEEWRSAEGKPFVTYPSLIPGWYTFSLKVCKGENNCSPEIKFGFRILKPWYKRLDVILIACILMVFGVFTIYKLRVKKLEQDRQKLKELVEIQTKDLNDSINYAKRIQNAVLPLNDNLFKAFPNSFILFQPKDVVSGDFYWHAVMEKEVLIGAIDCTGHGVPGAFMSIIGITLLNEIVINDGISKPSDILDKLNKNIIKSLKQDVGASKDGMDACFINIDVSSKKLQFSGAVNHLYIVRNKELIVVKGDHFPIGDIYNFDRTFTNNIVELQKGDRVYINSDGFQDQFGGKGVKDKKFLRKRYKELLLETIEIPMSEQELYFKQTFEDWRMDVEQTDDVLIIGIEIQ